MRIIIILLFGISALLAEDKKPVAPTVEALQAEVAALKAQLAEFNKVFQYEQRICQDPELMKLRLVRIDAASTLEKVKNPPKDKK